MRRAGSLGCAYLKLDMRALGRVSASHCAHDLSRLDLPTFDHADLFEVEVQCVHTLAMAEDDGGSVPLEGAREDDPARSHSSYG